MLATVIPWWSWTLSGIAFAVLAWIAAGPQLRRRALGWVVVLAVLALIAGGIWLLVDHGLQSNGGGCTPVNKYGTCDE